MRTPSHRSIILVTAAISVAVTSLYAQTMGPGPADSATVSDVRTLEEFEFERQLADRIEVMLRTLLGNAPVVVMVEADVSSGGIQADVEGTQLDAMSSLPGLPVARSRDVTAARRTMTVHRVSVTVYHAPNLPEDQLVQVRSLVPKWAGLDLDRGDTVDMRPTLMADDEAFQGPSQAGWIWPLLALVALLVAVGWWSRLRGSGSLDTRSVSDAPSVDSEGGTVVAVAGSSVSAGGASDIASSAGTGGDAMSTVALSAVAVEPPGVPSTTVHGLARRAFAFTDAMTDEQVLSIVKDSTPVEIGLVLSSLSVRRSTAILEGLSHTLQVEVLEEVGKGLSTTPSELQRLRHVLQHRLDQQILHPDELALGGERRFSTLMGALDLASASRLIGEIASRNPRLSEIARQEVFFFEDLKDAGEAVVRGTLLAVDARTMGMALSTVDDAFREKVLVSCGERMAAILDEEIDVAAFRDPIELERAREIVARTAGRISRESMGENS